MPFAEFIEGLLRSQAVRKFYAHVLDDHVLDKSYTPATFEPDEAYFVLTLSEMYLHDRREYWRGFIPLCLVISEFDYDNEREVTPFFVGNRLLSSIEALVKDQQVEYRNTTVAGPLPYVGGNVSLFTGMFRVAVDDLAKALFGFIEQVADPFTVSGFSGYLNIAKVVAKGLPDLLGMKNVEFRFGMRDEFGSRKRKGHVLRQGYITYVNCPEQNLKVKDLWVEDGRLLIHGNGGRLMPYKGNDFCLMRIDHLTERDDYKKLQFYPLWKSIQGKIWDGDIEKARKEILPRLAREVALSPDLVRSDKFHLQEVFKLNFEREVDAYFKMTDSRKRPVRATRGPDERLSAKEKIQKAVAVGRTMKTISEDVETALQDVVEKLDRIPHFESRAGRARLTERQLKEQLRCLKEITGAKKPDPDALAETLVADAISFRSRE